MDFENLRALRQSAKSVKDKILRISSGKRRFPNVSGRHKADRKRRAPGALRKKSEKNR